ncbi:MAG: hypothetical protein GKR88_13645 [Flavobacteriaceae bacterium]|nr:MAG: hypothetical protein GKR88_13645 [Flavobacteriaceae bacterium]
MKQLIFAFIFTISITQANAQKIVVSDSQGVKVGDVFEINKPKHSQTFKYIYFPRPNFIIKRGGIIDYKRIYGNKVVVTSIKKKDNVLKVRIKKYDGGKFFNSYDTVLVDIKGALKAGELQRI